MTLSNRREPSFHGPQGSPHSPAPAGPHITAGDAAAHKAVRASGLTRVVSTAQIVGSLLAVPLGLASGYSMYKANFAVDTTCQNLRANIIAMLDKNVDASTRRMLVRRDITTFEQTCGSFDPDAHAAFKTLLAAPPAPAPAATAAAPKLRSALPATDVARKIEPKAEKAEAKAESKPEPKAEPKAEAKAEPKNEPRHAATEKPPVPAPASIEAIEGEAALSDTRWLAAVRQALVTNAPEAAPVKGSPPAMLEVPKSARAETLAVAKPAVPPVQLQPTWNVPAAAPSAPALPQTLAPPPVAAVTAAPQIAAPAPPVDVPMQAVPVKDNAPRPPAPITGPTPINGAAEADDSGKSRLGAWIAQIPLVGRVIEPRGD